MVESVKEAAVQSDGIQVEMAVTQSAGGAALAQVVTPASPAVETQCEAQREVEVEQDQVVVPGGASTVARQPRQRRKRHIFTEYEDKLLMKVLEKRPGERKQELERLANLFAVPYLTLRHRFYAVIRRKHAQGASAAAAVDLRETAGDIAAAPEPSAADRRAGGDGAEERAPTPTTPRDPMEELLTLPARVERIERRLHGMLDLKGFVDRLIDINKQLEREQRLLEELAQKDREIERLREEMQKKIQRINSREQELDDLYKQLETTLHQFMNLSSIDKLKVLGDFTIKIETVIDRFGNVIRRRPIVVP